MFLQMTGCPNWFVPRVVKLRIGGKCEEGKVHARNNGMIYWCGEDMLYQDEDGKQWRVKLEPVVDEIEQKEKKKKK